jgi:parallel beta-helix repeat protein
MNSLDGGIGFLFSASTKIVSNYIDYGGIGGYRSPNATIVGNTLINGSIGLSHSSDSTINNNVVSNFPLGQGISFYDGHNGTIEYNTVFETEYCIDVERSLDVVINGNKISNCSVRGIYMVHSSPLIMGNELYNNRRGIVFYYLSNATVINNTIKNSTELDFRFNEPSVVYVGSYPVVINTSFSKSKVGFYRLGGGNIVSNFTVNWYMHVKVEDLNNKPVAGAAVEVRDNNGMLVGAGTSDAEGYLKWIVSKEYFQNDTNNDGDGEDPGEKIFFTPHNVTVSKDGYVAYANPEPNMTESKEVIVRLPVAYTNYTITKSPLQGNVTVDGAQYPVPAKFSWLSGDTHTISVDSPESCGTDCHYVYDYWDDSGTQTHDVTVGSIDTVITAHYNTQYRPTITLLGTDSINTVAAHYTQSGSPVSNPGNFDLWSDWCDEGTSLSFDTETEGSTSVERRLTLTVFTGSPWDSVTSAFAETVIYHHQLKPTIITNGLSPEYPALVNFTLFGNPYNTTTSTSWSNWTDTGIDVNISDMVNVSGRERYRTLGNTSWTVDSAFTATVNYIHQYKPIISLVGTDNIHTVGVIHEKDASYHNDTGIHTSWSDWVDENTTLSFDECTSGSPIRCTTDTRTWTVASAFNATINYTEDEVDTVKETNYKPFVALIFCIILFLVGAYVADRKPLRLKDDEKKNKMSNFLFVVMPFVIIEALTGIISLLTGFLSIPPLIGPGTIVDFLILVAGLITFVLVYKGKIKSKD